MIEIVSSSRQDVSIVFASSNIILCIIAAAPPRRTIPEYIIVRCFGVSFLDIISARSGNGRPMQRCSVGIQADRHIQCLIGTVIGPPVGIRDFTVSARIVLIDCLNRETVCSADFNVS